jgi:hypothetical protein
MSKDVSKIRYNGVLYHLKDEPARLDIATLAAMGGGPGGELGLVKMVIENGRLVYYFTPNTAIGFRINEGRLLVYGKQ